VDRRRKTGDVFVLDGITFLAELLDRRVHVNGIGNRGRIGFNDAKALLCFQFEFRITTGSRPIFRHRLERRSERW
jgi:hypothetical protein